MAAAYLKPGCLVGSAQPDDRYLSLVERFGDTTNAMAHVRALERLGIQATFRTDGCIEQLIAQLRLGLPIPAGWLHRGPVSAPSGGGHWSLVVGWDPHSRQVIMHDPNGEADLVGGGYVSTAIGEMRPSQASRANFRPRASSGLQTSQSPNCPRANEMFLARINLCVFRKFIYEKVSCYGCDLIRSSG